MFKHEIRLHPSTYYSRALPLCPPLARLPRLFFPPSSSRIAALASRSSAPSVAMLRCVCCVFDKLQGLRGISRGLPCASTGRGALCAPSNKSATPATANVIKAHNLSHPPAFTHATVPRTNAHSSHMQQQLSQSPNSTSDGSHPNVATSLSLPHFA